MRSLEQWLAYQTQVHPQAIDLGLDRLRVVLERLAVAAATGPGHHRRRHQRQGLGQRLLRGHPERRGLPGRHLYLAAPARLPRAHPRSRPLGAAPTNWWRHSRKSKPRAAAVALTFFEFNALAALLIFEAARSMPGCSKSAWADAWMPSMWSIRMSPVVTSIGLDHQEYLGDTLEAIAREKAGIFRAGRTAVIGGREPLPVLESVARSRECAAEAARHRIQLHSGRRGLALSRHALGLAPPAGAGAHGRHSIHQCRDGYRRAGGNCPAPQRCPPLRSREDSPQRALGRPLPSDQPRQQFADVGFGCRAQSGRRARAGAESERQPASRAGPLAVCGILADKDAAAIVSAIWMTASTHGGARRSTERAAAAVEALAKRCSKVCEPPSWPPIASRAPAPRL